MRQKSGPEKAPAEQVVKDIRRATRRQFSAEEKIRIVLEGRARRREYRRTVPARGDRLIDVLRLVEGVPSTPASAGWPATRRVRRPPDEVKELRREAQALRRPWPI